MLGSLKIVSLYFIACLLLAAVFQHALASSQTLVFFLLLSFIFISFPHSSAPDDL